MLHLQDIQKDAQRWKENFFKNYITPLSVCWLIFLTVKLKSHMSLKHLLRILKSFIEYSQETTGLVKKKHGIGSQTNLIQILAQPSVLSKRYFPHQYLPP